MSGKVVARASSTGTVIMRAGVPTSLPAMAAPALMASAPIMPMKPMTRARILLGTPSTGMTE